MNKWFWYYTLFTLRPASASQGDPWRVKSRQERVRTAGIHLCFAQSPIWARIKTNTHLQIFFSASAQSWRKFLAEFSCKQLYPSQSHLGCFVPAVNWHLANSLLASLLLPRCPQPGCRRGTVRGFPRSRAVGTTCLELVKLLILSGPLWRDPVWFGIYAGANVNYLTVVVRGPACCSTRRFRDN